MIARSAPHRRNRRNLAPNPGLLAFAIQPVFATAVATDCVEIQAPSTMGTYVRSTRVSDYQDWTNNGEQPIAVTLGSAATQIALQYPTTPIATDTFKIPSGELGFRTRLGGQIAAQTLVVG